MPTKILVPITLTLIADGEIHNILANPTAEQAVAWFASICDTIADVAENGHHENVTVNITANPDGYKAMK